jgi:hypothetical protein
MECVAEGEHALGTIVGHPDDQVSLANCGEALLVGCVKVGRQGQGLI